MTTVDGMPAQAGTPLRSAPAIEFTVEMAIKPAVTMLCEMKRVRVIFWAILE
jgi:hypothetical protein